MLSLRRDIVVLLQPVLCCFRRRLHVADKHVLSLLDQADAHYLLVSRFAGVHFNMNCMNVHVLKTL